MDLFDLEIMESPTEITSEEAEDSSEEEESEDDNTNKETVSSQISDYFIQLNKLRHILLASQHQDIFIPPPD